MNASVFVCIGVLSLCQNGDAAPDPRLQISTAVPAMIAALEKQEYRRLIEEYVDPADLDEALRHRMEADAHAGKSSDEARQAALGRLVENFGGRQAKELLAALQSVSVSPSAEAPPDQDRVTLKSEGLPRPLIFVRVRGLWRLKN